MPTIDQIREARKQQQEEIKGFVVEFGDIVSKLNTTSLIALALSRLLLESIREPKNIEREVMINAAIVGGLIVKIVESSDATAEELKKIISAAFYNEEIIPESFKVAAGVE